jgi:hypothetical protein
VAPDSACSAVKASPIASPARRALDRQVVGPRHHRGRRGEHREVFLGRRRDRRTPPLGIGPGAKCGDMAAAAPAPVGEDLRQELTQLGGPEPQEPVPMHETLPSGWLVLVLTTCTIIRLASEEPGLRFGRDVIVGF